MQIYTAVINAVVILVSVYFGYYLGEQSRIKKDKKEAVQMLNILQDEINNNLSDNLQNEFSSEYLYTLGEEILRVKAGILAAHQREHLGYFIKIYGQFNNINKALSNYIVLEQARNPGKKIRENKKLIQLRSSCKKDIETYLKKTSG